MLKNDEFSEIKELEGLFNSLSPEVNNYITCTYCGCPATDREHVTPLSWIKKYQELKDMGIDIDVPKEVIVPSCQECNKLAYDRLFENVRTKKHYINAKIADKYRKLLDSPDWEDEELVELDGR